MLTSRTVGPDVSDVQGRKAIGITFGTRIASANVFMLLDFARAPSFSDHLPASSALPLSHSPQRAFELRSSKCHGEVHPCHRRTGSCQAVVDCCSTDVLWRLPWQRHKCTTYLDPKPQTGASPMCWLCVAELAGPCKSFFMSIHL